jgi:SAM-dependent methyltransferase
MAGSSEDALTRWHDDLLSWAIPDHILRAVRESPWDLPRTSFTTRARRMVGAPSGASYERAREALGAGGSVLDVGCGAGAASLPLSGSATEITGVDESDDMLDAFRTVSTRPVGTVRGSWPQIAPDVPAADVVVCHHVLYNVADLAPFVVELTRHARRQVVVELTARHPMSALNPLWARLQHLVRPERPTAVDALAALRSLGLAVQAESWSTPVSTDFGRYEEMLAVTARRLCLPADRLGELDAALRDLGVDPRVPRLGTQRDLVTLRWPGSASDR